MAQASKPAGPVKTSAPLKTETAAPTQFIFGKENYRLLIISIAVVAFGFILMSGTTDIYSTTKIVIAPIGGTCRFRFRLLRDP
jgi:hypothetical protein